MNISQDQNHYLVTLDSEFTIHNVAEAKRSFDEMKFSTGKKLVWDLKNLSRIDTAGIQFLISCKNWSASNGLEMGIINHTESIIGAFDLLGLAAYFGDSIKMSKEMKENYKFSYGRKKGFY
ncbi:STAS domain-containing protein [Leptospira sp. GIMC2001]|uniref:STAS domain-containing protein n=1 Tax=Leptospira sp. GIMC2001 TaxID=1513297 RepID=UPI00234932B5|nr:STAS domain-containing protein [Leptospira sp. GIMC2001]WCL47849.1 STAS domain-containing protein [Leptospira sp. GIMC2001]